MEIKYPKEYKRGNDFDTYDFGWMCCWSYALKYFEKELNRVMESAEKETEAKK